MGPEERRLLWISLAMRVHVRPLVVAEWIRRGGAYGAPAGPSSSGESGPRIPPRAAEREAIVAALASTEGARALESECERLGDRILTLEEGGWLARLWQELPDPPACLFVRGRLHGHGADAAAVAIIGARYASSGGIAMARSLARDLAARGVTIVSGLALGIDGAAHRGALDAGGHTVAVLGGGLDLPTPPSHRDLSRRIAATGGLASEFPPGTPPRPIHFPRRNRILAALASVVVIVEGRERSGARSTIDHALAMGREVGAVPRDPLHEGSRLPNMLLQSGASPITGASDVIALLEHHGRRIVRSGPHPALQDVLLRHLDAPRDLEYLVGRLGKGAGEILACLGGLEAAGEVRRLPGMRYGRATAGALS